MGNQKSIPETLDLSGEYLLVDYQPKNKWHRFDSLYSLKGLILTRNIDLDLKNLKLIRVTPGFKYLYFEYIQETGEFQPRFGSRNFSYKVNPTETEEFSYHFDKGWVNFNNILPNMLPYDIVKLDLSLSWFRYSELVNRLKLDPMKYHLFDINMDPYIPKEDLDYNKNLDKLTDPLTFEPKEYPYHLAHAVPKNAVREVLKGRQICIDARCLDEVYDEKSGIFLGIRKDFSYQFPGIYMELLQHTRIKPYPEPMTLSDLFQHFRYLNTDNQAAPMFGEVGFIYSFEDIFTKYRVSLKRNLRQGKGESITLDEYINNFGGECVIRANKISTDNIAAMYIKFTFTEIDFIYDKLLRNKKESTLRDVIKLYLTFKRNKVSPWFVRKSALKAVLDGYGIKSIQSKNLKRLPLIFAMTPGRGSISSITNISIYNNPEQDVESDHETFDPNK